jgi:choline dehydrogenase
VNGLYMVRASKQEHDLWGRLIGASELWGWDNMLRAMKKSENFTQPAQKAKESVPSLQWNSSSHGSTGPIQTGWPAISYPIVESYLQAASAQGTNMSSDPNNGASWGSFLATPCIDQTSWERSSSRTGYLGGSEQRPNLHVLTNHQVTKVLLDTSVPTSVEATGVQYAAGAGQQVKTVYARREVVISGGSINSPLLLQQSGIGDKEELKSVGIEVMVDLAGVGHNMQDHLSSSVVFTPRPDVRIPQTSITGDRQEDSFVNSAISYVNMKTLLGDYSETLISNARDNLTAVINSAAVSDAVKKAYNVTYTTQVEDVFTSDIGPVELLFALTYGQVMVQVALQQPLSRGSITPSSSDPFQAPKIDAGYLRQDVDLQLLREGFKLARRVGNTKPLSDHVLAETSPGPTVQTDEEWESWIRNNVGTEYHPSSTCSMLPREQGGVVDGDLLVYGTKNLRVIDASVPPMTFSAHLMSITYGIGEIGAEIIKKARQQQQQQQSQQMAAPTATSSSSDSTHSAPIPDSNLISNGALSLSLRHRVAYGAAAAAAAVAAATFNAFASIYVAVGV